MDVKLEPDHVGKTFKPLFRCISRTTFFLLRKTLRGAARHVVRTSEQVAMPRPMKVKIFMDSSASAIEGQINAWLDQLGSASIIKTETALTSADKPNGGTYPCIVVTVWYELRD